MTDTFSLLYGPLFSSPPMRALLSDSARLQRMLDVEAALARAESAVSVIPPEAAEPIARCCAADLFDCAALGEAAASAGNLAIPLVKALTAEVAKSDAKAAGYVHWGATSQDIIDTALMLELRAAIDLLDHDLGRAIAGFAALAQRHRATPMAGRTFLQYALPLPFGLKLAGYAGALARSRTRLTTLRKNGLALQFGGAVGTLASLGDKGVAVAEQLAAKLDLPLPDAPWHAHRDRPAEIAAALAILTGTCGKIARDVTLLMQTDVGEAFEPAAPGRGGSSTMPQKRNPVAASVALAAAAMSPNLIATLLAAQVQEHERGAGAWHVEWVTYPALLLISSAALAAIVDIAEGLEVDAARMHANLESSGGQIMAEAVMMALAPKLGRLTAHDIVGDAARKASKNKTHLEDALTDDPRIAAHLNPAERERLFDPLAYQGVAQVFIDRLLESVRKT